MPTGIFQKVSFLVPKLPVANIKNALTKLGLQSGEVNDIEGTWAMQLRYSGEQAVTELEIRHNKQAPAILRRDDGSEELVTWFAVAAHPLDDSDFNNRATLEHVNNLLGTFIGSVCGGVFEVHWYDFTLPPELQLKS